MNGYNFTERVRHVLQYAREESARLQHEYVGPEHILLAIIREGDGVGIAALRSLGKDPAIIRDQQERNLSPGSFTGVGPDLPYTERGKRVLELAMTEARELNHSYVGSEHLMLGLLREETSSAARVLAEANVTLDEVRAEIVRLHGVEGKFKRSATSELVQPSPSLHPVPRASTILHKAGIVAIVLLMITAMVTLWVPWGSGSGMWVPKVLLTGLIAGLAGVAVAVMREATRY